MSAQYFGIAELCDRFAPLFSQSVYKQITCDSQKTVVISFPPNRIDLIYLNIFEHVSLTVCQYEIVSLCSIILLGSRFRCNWQWLIKNRRALLNKFLTVGIERKNPPYIASLSKQESNHHFFHFSEIPNTVQSVLISTEILKNELKKYSYRTKKVFNTFNI